MDLQLKNWFIHILSKKTPLFILKAKCVLNIIPPFQTDFELNFLNMIPFKSDHSCLTPLST
jgi:hypothetical protein